MILTVGMLVFSCVITLIALVSIIFNVKGQAQTMQIVAVVVVIWVITINQCNNLAEEYKSLINIT